MGRILDKADGITIEANISPCAHICRYCSIGDRAGKFPLDRFIRFVDRFRHWKQERASDLWIGHGFMPAFNFDIDEFQIVSDW
ncbi:MAG: hypothetical protein WDO56_05255 [Gammaproteobacteria bacterium]